MIEIGGYRFDLAKSERLTYEADVTEHPVEKGADVTDHIRAKLAAIEVEVVCSDTPVGRIALVRQLDGDGSATPSRDALEKLRAMHFARQPVKYIGSFGVFDTMAIESIETTKDAASQHALIATISLREIRIVETERTKIRAVVGAGKRSDRGHVVPVFNATNTQIFVVSRPTEDRRTFVARYGVPLLTTNPQLRAMSNHTSIENEPFAGLYSGSGIYDHYNYGAGPKNIQPDGFVQDHKYYRLSKGWVKDADGQWKDTFHGNSVTKEPPTFQTDVEKDAKEINDTWDAVGTLGDVLSVPTR
jgi:hypothetical protein